VLSARPGLVGKVTAKEKNKKLDFESECSCNWYLSTNPEEKKGEGEGKKEGTIVELFWVSARDLRGGGKEDAPARPDASALRAK